MEKLYAACDIKSASLEDVKEILEKIADASSSFHHFLNTVNYHTEVFSNPQEVFSRPGRDEPFRLFKKFDEPGEEQKVSL